MEKQIHQTAILLLLPIYFLLASNTNTTALHVDFNSGLNSITGLNVSEMKGVYLDNDGLEGKCYQLNYIQHYIQNRNTTPSQVAI